MTLNPFHDAKVKKQEQEALLAHLAELQTKADEREPRVNAIWAWAKDRRMSNGVGHDFEFDLSNPRQFRGTS